jgi:hypothetical protein
LSCKYLNEGMNMYVQETTENGKQSSSTLMPALVLNQANTHTPEYKMH